MRFVAQCAPGGPCELPTGLPWYFGVAVAAVWLAVVVGALVLGRRLLVRRIERRRHRHHDHDRPALEQSTSGPDLERW